MPLRGHARLTALCRGVVQGVGFRPRVWQQAQQLGLAGFLANVADGVALDLQGEQTALELFLERLPCNLPAAARLEALEIRWAAPLQPPPQGLQILADPPRPLGHGLIAPSLVADRAPCPACCRELFDPSSRRYRYPFVSCSTCGPRYSIATAEPFVRAHTTLAIFPLCSACQAEFEDPADRRFHAETIGCPACGPRLRLLEAGAGPFGEKASREAAVIHPLATIDPLAAAVALLRDGAIVALKGVGGFQLLVNAADGAAVARLRARKRRPHKPFALLVETPEGLAGLVTPSAAERAALVHPAAPIVLLPCPDGVHEGVLPGVAPGAPGLGVMLPASPLHLLLARDFAGPLVATSGNRSGEPLCTHTAEALADLAGIADAFLMHDRPIARPLDDSVLQIIDNRPALLRRARGYAPEPLSLPPPQALSTADSQGWGEGSAVLALGGDVKGAPALALGDRLWLSPHLGDLADGRVQERWRQGVAELLERHGRQLAAVVVDRHPGYVSHQGAGALLADAGLAGAVPLVAVGHHHAHGLAVAAEHGLAVPLAVLAFDGLGYGDGPAPLWGGELLLVEAEGPQRLASLRPFPLPGGERAMREPRRSALGLLHEAGLLHHPGAAALRAAFAPEELALLERAITSGCHAPRTSSAGRLFDAVAALLGLVTVASHEAQAGLALQAAADRAATGRGAEASRAYPLPLRSVQAAEATARLPLQLDWQPLLAALLADIAAGRPPESCAARFHNGLVAGLAAAVLALVNPALPVALAGGCFQNRRLLEGLIAALRARGWVPFWSERLPANDGALAVGQARALRGPCPAPSGQAVEPPDAGPRWAL